jgi:CHASE3 domain sensor protein
MLKSALFWRILLSSLLVVAVLGVGLDRANSAHEELEKQFERLVQHDLKLADDAEQLLRLMADLETGKRGYLLTGDRSFLAPYEQARKELEGLLPEAQAVAENGMEDERVAAFGRLVHDWIENVSEPQIRNREKGSAPDPAVADEGKTRTDEMRAILTDLRRHALDAADAREQAAFQSASASQVATRSVLLLAIAIALGSGTWIARDIAGATANLEHALVATGRLESVPMLPTSRRDELGAVAFSLAKMNALLLEKDASLRATLGDRERAVTELTRANADLAMRDARAREYAEFVRELQALDVAALATGGLQTLARLSDAQVAVVFLLDDADRLVPVHAAAADGRAIDHRLFGAEGLPKSVMDTREPIFLYGDSLGAPLPTLDLGVGTAPLRARAPGRARERGSRGDRPRRYAKAERRSARVHSRRRAAARSRTPQCVDARSAARQERGACGAGRAADAGKPGEDGVSRVDEPRATNAAERDPRLRRLADGLAERATFATST